MRDLRTAETLGHQVCGRPALAPAGQVVVRDPVRDVRTGFVLKHLPDNERASEHEPVERPITDEGVAFGSDTAVGMMSIAHSRRRCASVSLIVTVGRR